MCAHDENSIHPNAKLEPRQRRSRTPMASPAQHAANIANAAFSTGPRTAEGKAAASANALSHGMTSGKVVLPHEDEAAYLALLDCTLDYYNPAGELERTLAVRVAETLWRAT